MRVVIIGAGPAGLYAAWAIRRRNPRADVTLWEQHGPGPSGFGVVISCSALTDLALRDPALARHLDAAGEDFATIHLQMNGAHEHMSVPGFVGVARSALLQMLRDRCRDMDVTLHYRTSAAPLQALAHAADVVVIAEGVASQTRCSLASRLGARSTQDGAYYTWLGTSQHFEGLTFAVCNSPAGPIVAHAYPYSPDRSTFIVEVGAPDLPAAGVSDPSDPGAPSAAALERLLASTLQGHPLLSNRSRWQRFRSISNDVWWVDNIVFIGDAAHTTHYSIGSGTKLALDDAATLAESLAGEASVQRAYMSYEAARRPVVTKAQDVAERSRRWFAGIGDVLREPPAEVLHSLATRGGSIRSSDLDLADGPIHAMAC